MDALERRERAIDIAAQFAHLPLRVYVMGDRAIRREPATGDDIAEMRRLTIEALNVGAFGFTTSRTDSHKTPAGDPVPSRDADAEELLGIGSALGAVGAGAFGMNSDFDDETYELALADEARARHRPTGLVPAHRPLRGPGALASPDAGGARGARPGPAAHRADRRPADRRDDGHRHRAQPVHGAPELQADRSLRIAEQHRRLADPQLRRQILAEKPSEAEIAKLAQFRQLVTSRWDRFFVMGNPPDYEPTPEMSVAAIAAREGRTPDEVAYDYITEAEGRYLYFPVVNYVVGDHEPIREMLNDPACLLGLSDGGAHCTSIVDAGLPSFMLAHWGRDRMRGPRLPLELLVKRQTSETADFFGLTDRGRLAPGLRADVNLIDFDRLRLHKPELVHDMPANGRRFIQRVEGYAATLVAGAPIFERGEHTGAMPGRLVRAGRIGAASQAA